MRYELRAVATFDDLPEEWAEDIKEDTEDTLRHYGGAAVTVELKETE